MGEEERRAFIRLIDFAQEGKCPFRVGSPSFRSWTYERNALLDQAESILKAQTPPHSGKE